MPTEDEFLRWLNRTDKTFLENFKFALKAWNAAEFTFSRKYELILCWLTTEVTKLCTKLIPYGELIELLQLRAQPGLISLSTKEHFIEIILNLFEKWTMREYEEDFAASDHLWPKLLYCLCNFEVFQDLYRTKYDIHARIYAALLKSYELYLKQHSTLIDDCISTTTSRAVNVINTAKEADFFVGVLTDLRDHIKRTGDGMRLDKKYCQFIVQPLVRVILLLKTHSLCFFDELHHLERLLTDHHTDEELVKRIQKLPLHVRLVLFQCSIVNRRGVESYLHHLLLRIFLDLPKEVEVEKHEGKGTSILLTAAAYTLETFRKHDINLNFKMDLDNQPSAMSFLGEQLLKCIQLCKNDHLREVLMLLGATLRLNPLILEQDIFQITTWMIVAEKNHSEEYALFGEYLVSLMDMFRRLSRVEKLVFNLLKSLKEWLHKFEISTVGKSRKSLKRKAEAMREKEAESSTCTNDENIYLHIIFKEFHNTSSKLQPSKNMTNKTFENAFPHLRANWPCESVGFAFSKLITGLVSKPALVIWKSLLYSLKELLVKLSNQPELGCQENSQFLLDLHSALLCQYFSGCRLVEQYDKFTKEIYEQMHITRQVLAQFGAFLLSQEHSTRTMNAFLECAFHTTNFELLLDYYRPDGFENKRNKQIHEFLSTEQWTVVHERVVSCAKAHTKFLFNRILLQRSQAPELLHNTQRNSYPIDLQTILQSTVLDTTDNVLNEVITLVEKMPSTKWFITKLGKTEKTRLISQLLDAPAALANITEDLASLEILAIALCDRIFRQFTTAAKGPSTLAALKCDFNVLDDYLQADQNTAEKELMKFISTVEVHVKSAYNLKMQSDAEEMQKLLKLCGLLPLGHLRRQIKNLLFTILIAFYGDLRALNVTESNIWCVELFEIIIDFLHFGQHVPIFKYFSLSTILQIFPIAKTWKFYEFVFATIKTEKKGSEQFLTAMAENLEATQNADFKLGDDQRRLLLIAIETLAALSGPRAKRARKYLERLLAIYSKHIMAHFSRSSHRDFEAVSDGGEGCAKKDKKFVEKTLAGFAPYANALLVNASGSGTAKGTDNGQGNAIEIDENFRRICKIYIGHSMDYRNPYAIRLMQVALNHRQLLHLDQDEIEFVLTHYWQQLNSNLETTNLNDAQTLKTLETTVKMIIGNKTNEDLLLTLQSLTSNLGDLKDFRNILHCLELIAKCSFSTIKGAIFNEKFKSILCRITMRLVKDEQQQFVDKEQLLAIMAAQQSLVENKMIPISTDTLDGILAFLMDINIKKLPISEENLLVFKKLHLAMSDLLSVLIRQRHMLLMDRVPQLMHIFKDLIQSIVWYKSDRQKDAELSGVELEDLAEMAMKLEALMHLIAAHSIHVKRVVPFVLTFVIGLMVANKRATTLYPKIKTHIDNVCYDLVGICDHRVGRFILRCSNEAARHVYEVYVKEHKKYHKFKGKV